jgi:HlyD family secretion protein
MKVIERIVRGSVVAVMAGLLVAGCSESDASEGATDDTGEVALVERGDLDVRVEAAGQVEPILVVEVKSKASGEITRLHIDTGDRVERGELLAEVDPRDVRNALAQAQADLEVAKARLQISESQAERSRDLRDANVVTQQELEQAVLDAANARAQLIKAETNLELAQERMGDVTIRAPITGTIIEKGVEAGQIIASASGNVSGGTTLMLMADLAEMQVRTLVDETDIGKVQAGQGARVQVEAYPNRTFNGTVLKIEPQAVIDQNVTMFPVLVRLDNREGLLKPNMNAEVQIEVAQRQDVVLVPNAAVVSLQDAAAAGEVLGLSGDDVREQMRAGRTGGAAQRPGGTNGAGAADEGGAEAGGGGEGRGSEASTRAAADARGGAAAGGDAEAQEDCASMMARLRGADRSSLSDEERARARECFQQMRGQGGGRFGRSGGGDGESRPAVVFVTGANGPEARMVRLGVNDWDRTEVVSGLERGEEVILISVARLRAQQEDLMNRIRERSSPIPGGGRGR